MINRVKSFVYINKHSTSQIIIVKGTPPIFNDFKQEVLDAVWPEWNPD